MIDLKGKRALVCGVASNDSIAWSIAKQLYAAGARICLSYQQRFRSRVLQLVRSGEIEVEYCERCDVTDEQELQQFFAGIPGAIDIVVHSIAYAPPETFRQPIYQVSQTDFQQALTISCHSLLALTQAALPHLQQGASLLTMTYLGGQRVVANYKLMGVAKAALEATVRELAADVGPMGIRVNAISAGPIKTLAASQIGGFEQMLSVYEAVTPMRRSINQDDVGNLAVFLSSKGASNITGQVMFVDAGYSSLAMAELPGASQQTEQQRSLAS